MVIFVEKTDYKLQLKEIHKDAHLKGKLDNSVTGRLHIIILTMETEN